jgi:cation diffusion facilitator CzcD-associated flavoprotein CzcO
MYHKTVESIQHVEVAIAGSGFAGLAMAIRLLQRGERDFVVLERAGDVGGTWRDNSYPGCACDVPSHLYSFSFEPNPHWSRTFSPQPEIQDYLRHCARKYGVLPHVRFDSELLDARWDEAAQRWILQTAGGPLTARVLVAATGPLSEPSIPVVPGLDSFRGTVFHSARWNHEHDLRGRRVAVVGTGASAIQFVPRIQPQVEHLTVFQRTPAWVMPHPDRPLRPAERAVYDRLPGMQALMRGGIYWARESFVIGFLRNRMTIAQRMARRHLEKQVTDPALRARLTPSYRIGCKRILISNDWYPALAKPNVEVVAASVREVREHSVIAADGSEHQVDTIIFGTGFHVTDMPVGNLVRGRDGATLAETWQGSPQAYLGTSVAGFPNFFILLGPNTGLGHTSVVLMAESQVDYVLDAMRTMRERGAAAVEVRGEAQVAYNREVQARMRGTVWTSGGCASWYIDATGRNSTLWPGSTWSFRRRTRRFDPEHYELHAPVQRPVSAPAA